MNDKIESRSLQRRIALMIMASAFLAWQIPIMDFFSKLVEGNQTVVGLISAAGFLIWAGTLVFLLFTGRIAVVRSDPKVAAALEDELVRANRSKAFSIGYAVVLVTAALVFAISLFQPLTGMDAAHVILVAAVVAPMYAFVVLERINA
jgi:hypothetical protein